MSLESRIENLENQPIDVSKILIVHTEELTPDVFTDKDGKIYSQDDLDVLDEGVKVIVIKHVDRGL